MRAAFYGRKHNIGEGVYVVNWSFLVWFFIAALIGSINMMAFQVEQGVIYNAAQMQLITGLVGVVGALAFSIMGLMVIRKDTSDDVMNYTTYGVVGFAGARVAGAIVTQMTSLSSTFITSFTIVVTAAITEEALFSMAMTPLLYIAIKPIMEKGLGEEVGNMMAIIMTASMVSIAFAAFHIGVYGTGMTLMLYLAAARFVYCVIYMLSKNIMAPVYAHMLHNVLILFIGA